MPADRNFVYSGLIATALIAGLSGCAGTEGAIVNVDALKNALGNAAQPADDTQASMPRFMRRSGGVTQSSIPAPVTPTPIVPQQSALAGMAQSNASQIQLLQAQLQQAQAQQAQLQQAQAVEAQQQQARLRQAQLQQAQLQQAQLRQAQIQQEQALIAQRQAAQKAASVKALAAQQAATPSVPTANLPPAKATAGSNVAHLGDVLTTPQGQTLYKHLKDGANQANCSDVCALSFGPYVPSNGAKPGKRYSFFMRTDGRNQWAFEGQPLYVYRGDLTVGQRNGDGKFNMIAVPFEDSGSQVAASSAPVAASAASSGPVAGSKARGLLKRLNPFKNR